MHTYIDRDKHMYKRDTSSIMFSRVLITDKRRLHIYIAAGRLDLKAFRDKGRTFISLVTS